MATLLSLSNFFVLPFWFLMIFLPYWRWTRWVMQVPWMVALLALLYALLALPQIAVLAPVLLRPSLTGIATLLGTPDGATIGWVHFLAFDLFVGRWIYFDSRERGISAWLSGPLLFLTLMLGPLGLLCYFLLRLYRRYVGISGENTPERAS
jgi:hypothetical protein